MRYFRAFWASSISAARAAAGVSTGAGKSSRAVSPSRCRSSAFRIDPGHPPIGTLAAEQTTRVIGDRVGMMLVHVPEDFRLCRSESGGSAKQQIAASIQ